MMMMMMMIMIMMMVILEANVKILNPTYHIQSRAILKLGCGDV